MCPGTNLNLYQEAKSWIDAMEHCQRGDSSVVEITNQTDNDKLKGLWKYTKDLKNGVWIGLERSIFGKNPEWKWISGSKVEYNQWKNSYSLNSLNYNCGKIILVNETKEIKWMNDNCHAKLPFICKSKLLFILQLDTRSRLVLLFFPLLFQVRMKYPAIIM